MKIKVNYDLIEKIKESKNGIRLHKIIKARAINITISLAFLTPIYIFSNSMKNIAAGLTGIMGANAFFLIRDCLFEKTFKNSNELEATLELISLANDLSNLKVETNAELLKDSKVIQTNYKIKFRDSDKLPVLKQEKYIEVPLCNGYTETLLQEHNVGSKNYDLSVQEPTKKMNFKLSRATQ